MCAYFTSLNIKHSIFNGISKYIFVHLSYFLKQKRFLALDNKVTFKNTSKSVQLVKYNGLHVKSKDELQSINDKTAVTDIDETKD